MELDEESRNLTAFITPYWRYRYWSGDTYTRRADDITKEVPRQCKVVDDTLLYDESISGNFYHMFDYLKLCGDNGITFNEDKFQFCLKEVEFSGFRVTADGIKPGEQILKDIAEFPEPTTLKEARRWFGLIEQVAWSHLIGDTMNNFRDLVKPLNKTWEWNALLREMSSNYKYYNMKKLKCVSTNWSKVGIGMPVTQTNCNCSLENDPRCCKDKFKIVFAGSERCSGAESHYAPIEGETLGVVWSLEKARMFTLGCPDAEYMAVKKAVLDGFPEKLEECIPLIQAYHKNKFNLSVVVEDKLEVVSTTTATTGQGC